MPEHFKLPPIDHLFPCLFQLSCFFFIFFYYTSTCIIDDGASRCRTRNARFRTRRADHLTITNLVKETGRTYVLDFTSAVKCMWPDFKTVKFNPERNIYNLWYLAKYQIKQIFLS